MIGNDDIVMTCILKTPNMLKQIQKAVEEKTPTKLIIESFQKWDGPIFTPEWTSLELDVEVLKKILFDNYKNTTKYLNDYYYYYKFVFILGHTKCYKRVQTRRHVCRYHWHSIHFYNGTKQDGIILRIHKQQHNKKTLLTQNRQIKSKLKHVSKVISKTKSMQKKLQNFLPKDINETSWTDNVQPNIKLNINTNWEELPAETT